MKTKGSTGNYKIEEILNHILKNMATKEDLRKELSKYPTKDDLSNELKHFATKDDLKHFATKDDLKSLEENIDKKLKVLRKAIKEDIAQATMDVFQSADSNKAEKAVVDTLAKRVDKIEQKLTIIHQ